MPTFIVDNNTAFSRPIVLNPEDEHHLTRVLRMKAGETFRVTNNLGKFAVLKVMGTRPFKFELLQIADGEPPVRITVCLPIIEQNRLEWAVEKLAELNIAAVQLVVCDFCQTKVLPLKKIGRLTKAAVAAQKQSGRTTPLAILPPRTLGQIMLPPGTVKIVADVNAEDSIQTAIKKISTHDWINLFVGPEGGFSPAEEKFFDSPDFTKVRLGGTILRSETAAVIIAGGFIF